MLGTHNNSRTFSRRSLHGQVAHEIGLRIVRGDYQPGIVLPSEERFCTELEVSRTALREAFKVLSSKGMLEARPKRGTIVKPRESWNMLDPDVMNWSSLVGPKRDYIRSLNEFRSIIEPMAAQLAAERATDEQLEGIEAALEKMKGAQTGTPESIQYDLQFHQLILHASGNELLATLGYVIESAVEQSIRLAHTRRGVREDSLPLHESVYLAIKAHNSSEARAAMEYLIKKAIVDIQISLDQLRKT